VTELWIFWGVFFAVIEGAALLNKEPGDTLSEHVWRWIGKRGNPKPSGYKWRRGALLTTLLWLIGHFFGDW